MTCDPMKPPANAETFHEVIERLMLDHAEMGAVTQAVVAFRRRRVRRRKGKQGKAAGALAPILIEVTDG